MHKHLDCSERVPKRCKQRSRFADEINRQIRRLSGLDNYHAFGAIVGDYVVIAISISLYFLSPWLLPFSCLGIASRQRALLTLLHESAHGVLAKNTLWNFVSGTIFSGWLVFQTHHRYHESHVRNHHGALGDPLHDPDTANYARQGMFRSTYDQRAFMKHILRKLTLVDGVAYIRTLLRERLLPKRWKSCRTKQKVEYLSFVAFWMTIISATYLTETMRYLFLFWLLPYLTATSVLGWLIELSEHYPLAAYSENDLQVTRNRVSGPIERFLTGAHGEQFHLTHHLRPLVPFWNVEQAHRCMLGDSRYRHAVKWSTGIFSAPNSSLPTIIEEIFRSLPSKRLSRWNEAAPRG